MTPQERKRDYRAYRIAARRAYQDFRISITESCSVSMISDGAFVEMVVWIPKSALTSTIYDEVLKNEKERNEH